MFSWTYKECMKKFCLQDALQQTVVHLKDFLRKEQIAFLRPAAGLQGFIVSWTRNWPRNCTSRATLDCCVLWCWHTRSSWMQILCKFIFFTLNTHKPHSVKNIQTFYNRQTSDSEIFYFKTNHNDQSYWVGPLDPRRPFIFVFSFLLFYHLADPDILD